MSTHTPGAIRAAEIITGATYGDGATIATKYGRKTVEGIADIIDRETGAAAHADTGCDCPGTEAAKMLRAGIAKAKGD